MKKSVLQSERRNKNETIQKFRHSRDELIKKYKHVRTFTEKITEPLEIEDYVIQVTENASPAKWHLAHTTWFFETFLLEKELEDYDPIPPPIQLFVQFLLSTNRCAPLPGTEGKYFPSDGKAGF